MIQKMKKNWMKIRMYLLRNKVMLTLFCFLGTVLFGAFWCWSIELFQVWIRSCY